MVKVRVTKRKNVCVKPHKQRIGDKVCRLKNDRTNLDWKLYFARKAIKNLKHKLKKSKDELRSTRAAANDFFSDWESPVEIEELEEKVEAYEKELKARNHELNAMVDDFDIVSAQLKKTVHSRIMCNLIYAFADL